MSPSIASLPPEILLIILEMLSKASLTMLAPVSKSFHTLVTAILYKNIDFTAPGIDTWCRKPHEEAMIRCRQHVFLLTLLIDNPTLAKHIYSFSWTEIGAIDVRGPNYCNYFSPSSSRQMLRRQQTQLLDGSALTNLLSLLVNVRHLYISNICPAGALGTGYTTLLPTPLVPKAKKIRLESWIDAGLAKDVLRHKSKDVVEETIRVRENELKREKSIATSNLFFLTDLEPNDYFRITSGQAKALVKLGWCKGLSL
ncbi:hypothetical protein EV356DRAFT_516924 [Viridothelium virens]|uniref:F-box domain-containing protein n=1 Tax=Viridothelium virens TaxID=1048519 RepID=A0A6A6H537_VIRVR|nr:hypothetical protein EV356DRAFT_516924 [Viridothelium virens]